MRWNTFNGPKGITKHQNDLDDIHYPDDGNVYVNMVGYDICILSLGYCITSMKVMHAWIELDMILHWWSKWNKIVTTRPKGIT
jgi:hypothetical protein